MTASLVASYTLAMAGLGLMARTFWQIREVLVHRKAAITALVKLLKAHNPDRARKLCAVAPHSLFTAVGAAIVAAQAQASRDPLSLAAVVEPAFAARAHDVLAHWRRLLELGLLGAMLVFGGVGLALSMDVVPVPLYGAGGVAGLYAGWLAVRRGAMADSLEAARLEVLPALVTAIAERPERPEVTTPEPPPLPVAGRPPTLPPSKTLTSGRCPLCGHATITRVDGLADPRFHKLVCRGCGYAQEFADLARLDA